MTKIRRTTVAIAAMLLISASVVEARQESPENTQNGSPATAVKAEPGGTATDSGVTRAAKAAGHGIERGAKAVAKGIGHSARAGNRGGVTA